MSAARFRVLVSLLALVTAQSAYAQNAPTTPSTGEIVVTAPREENAARLHQKAAPVIVNIQSAETIQKYPDYNAAEALGRIPGLSLSSDTGEGRFVQIRGIDANLNGATYGGVVLLNTFPAGTAASGSGRAVEFDTIPTGAIDGIVVYKTLSPDREAEGLGGQIELTPRTSKNIGKAFFEGELAAGYEPLHKHGGPYTASFAGGARAGAWSFVVTGSRKDDQRAVDDTEPSYANDGATDGGPGLNQVLGRTDFRRYDYSRRRFGYGGEIDYKPSDDHSFYLRADVAGYVERQLKDHFYANFDGNPSVPDTQGYVVDRFQPQIDVVNAEETHRNTVIAAGGEDHFGKLLIDYHAAYSRATYVQNYYYEGRFLGTDTYYGRYNNTLDPKRFYYQFFNDAALTSPFNALNVSQYGGAPGRARLQTFYETDRDHEYSGVFNVRHPLTLLGAEGQFKAGVSVRLRDKAVNDFAGFNRSSPAGLSAISQGIAPRDTYYFGRYPTAPLADFGALETIVRSAIPTLNPSLGRNFRDKEDVYAAYAMYTADFGKLGMLAGARVEQTRANYGIYVTTTPANGGPDLTNLTNFKRSYTNVFPTVQLKYSFRPDLLLRATYSTGIARPGFLQASASGGVDFTATPRPSATIGNPNLNPTTGNSFDADMEYYLPGGGIIEIGAFDKEFRNYIFRAAQVNLNSPIFNGVSGDLVSFFNESAYARGIEIAYQQKLTFLPGLLSGLGVEANLTLVKSRFLEYNALVSGAGRDQYRSLPGTSDVTWNLAGSYEEGPVQLRLAAQFVGASLFALNGDQSIDTIQSSRLTMDASSSYALNANAVLFFKAKNLLNTPLRYVDGTNARTQQIEYYGRTYEGGLRVKF